MFYKGLEPGVILYRKTIDGFDISQIKECYKLEHGRRYILYPIIGNWTSQCVIYNENTECSRWKLSHVNLYWYCWGTNFKKVYESNVV